MTTCLNCKYCELRKAQVFASEEEEISIEFLLLYCTANDAYIGHPEIAQLCEDFEKREE